MQALCFCRLFIDDHFCCLFQGNTQHAAFWREKILTKRAENDNFQPLEIFLLVLTRWQEANFSLANDCIHVAMHCTLNPLFWHNLLHCFTIPFRAILMYQYELHRDPPHMTMIIHHTYRLTADQHKPFLASSQVTVLIIMRCFVLLLDHVLFLTFCLWQWLCCFLVVKIKKFQQNPPRVCAHARCVMKPVKWCK